MQNFEDYLKDVHFSTYIGTDNEMSTAFEEWVACMDLDKIVYNADQYAKYVEQYVIDHLSDYLKKDEETNTTF